MKPKKFIVSLFLTLGLLLGLFPNKAYADSTDIPITDGDSIYVYSWNEELQNKIETYFLENHPEYKNKIKFAFTKTTDGYFEAVDEIISNPDNNTAIVAIEPRNLKNFWETGHYASLSSIGLTADDYAHAYPYTTKIGSKDSELMALPIQILPIHFLYNTKIAQKVLGTTDSEKVQEMINTPEKFIEVAEKMKDAGYYMTTGADLLSFLSSPEKSEDVNNDIETLYNQLIEKNYDSGNSIWDMYDTKFTDIRADKVFGRFSSFSTDAFDSLNSSYIKNYYDICEGPIRTYWGGTYIGVSNAGKKDEIALEVIKAICCDDDVAYTMATDEYAMDLPNNISALNKMVDDNTKGAFTIYKNSRNPVSIWNQISICTDVECLHPKTYMKDFKEVNCIDNGYTGDESCLICDALINQGKVVESSGEGHTSDGGTIKTTATCEKDGEKIYTCTVCEQVIETETLPKLGHNPILTKIINATCEEDGQKNYTCSRCSDNTIEVIPSSGHQYSLKETIAATCANEGESIYKCSKCNDEKTEYIPTLEHTYVLDSHFSYKANCYHTGQNYYRCKICGDTKTEEIPKTTHNYVLVHTTNPTCVDKGKKTFECEFCNDYKYEDIPATGIHTYDSWDEDYDDDGYAEAIEYECTVCRKSYLKYKPLITPAIYSVKNSKGKKVTVKWKKVNGPISGYEISISKNKNFKKPVTIKTTKSGSYTFKKLSKKKYYVRVRAYGVLNKVKTYSTYSKVKSIKVKN